VLTEIPCGVDSGWHIHSGEKSGVGDHVIPQF
jgi:hypothetical protein